MRFGRGKKNPMDHVDDAVERYRRGDEAGAMAALRRAIDSGDPQAAGEAGVKLGIMHRRAGDLAAAAEAYRAAAATGHPEKAPAATYLLAGVLEQQSRFAEAADAYRQAAEAGTAERPAALLGLAELYRFDLDDPEAATLAYRAAIDTGDEHTAPRAMVGLADFLGPHSPDKATELYERAAASDHPDAAPAARRALREHRREPAGPPSTRPAAGAEGCLLVLDGDGAVTGLWFEDAATGDAYAADREKVKGLLIANQLTSLLRVGYAAAPDLTTRGYRITFRL